MFPDEPYSQELQHIQFRVPASDRWLLWCTLEEFAGRGECATHARTQASLEPGLAREVRLPNWFFSRTGKQPFAKAPEQDTRQTSAQPGFMAAHVLFSGCAKVASDRAMVEGCEV